MTSISDFGPLRSGSGFSYLESQNLGLNEGERLSVDLDKAFTGLYSISVSTSDFHSFPIPSHVFLRRVSRVFTLQWATAVAVFFLPKH